MRLKGALYWVIQDLCPLIITMNIATPRGIMKDSTPYNKTMPKGVGREKSGINSVALA
jgi:hypothetical protein